MPISKICGENKNKRNQRCDNHHNRKEVGIALQFCDRTEIVCRIFFQIIKVENEK